MRYVKSRYEQACPICSNRNNELLYRVTANEAAVHFTVTHSIPDGKIETIKNKITGIWKSDSAAVVHCKNCGFIFSDPFIAGDQEFYNLLPHANAGASEHWKWEFEKTYNEIEKIASSQKDMTLLEIGASTGDFVKRIKNIIPRENIFCLEHSEIGVERIKKAGIEAHSWDFRTIKNKEGFSKRFDMICLFQVLEHLDNIDETFSTINYVVKPAGHLFIGVPNEKKITFNELNDALLDMPPNHIARYNQRSFEIVSEKYGWTIEEIAVEPYSVLEVMKTVMYYRSLKSLQFPILKNSFTYRIKEYIQIKYMQLQAIFRHAELGETRWVHLRKLDR